MTIKCVLLVIVPLVLVYTFFPDFFNKIVLDSIGLALSSRIDHGGEQRSENEINWSTLYVVLLITFAAVVVLCVLLRRYYCGLYLFYTWIVVCLIVEASLSVYISYNREHVKNITIYWLEKSFENYSDPSERIIRIIWNDIQSLLKCCGFYGIDSWGQHVKYLLKTYNSTLPNSCCETQVPCPRGRWDTAEPYKHQCAHKLNIYFSENAKLVIWTFNGLASVKVAAVLISNYYSTLLERVFQLSSSKFAHKANKIRSSKKCQGSNDIPLEKV